jgi:hypothetical protein
MLHEPCTTSVVVGAKTSGAPEAYPERRNFLTVSGVIYRDERAHNESIFLEGPMTSCCLFLFMISMATVSGQVLDREGKPMVGAQITYQKIGTSIEICAEATAPDRNRPQ